jgi:thiol-disulfide isomerase/thioredoxin
MKKYFPIILFTAIITAFLIGQAVFNTNDTVAGPSPENKVKIAHYESVYKDLELTDSAGEKYKLSESKSKIVVINFWASWCQPCLKEFPSLVELRNKYKVEDVLILGVNSDMEEPEKNMAKTIKQYKLNFPNVLDLESEVLNKFMITAIPVSIIYHNGKVIEVGNGEKDFMASDLQKKFAGILKN